MIQQKQLRIEFLSTSVINCVPILEKRHRYQPDRLDFCMLPKFLLNVGISLGDYSRNSIFCVSVVQI